MINIKLSFFAILAASGFLTGCGGGDSSSNLPSVIPITPSTVSTSEPGVSISLLSSRVEAVTSDSALVEVRVASNANLEAAKIFVGGNDHTAGFKATGSTTKVGLVAGLQPGQNDIVASVGKTTSSLRVVNTDKNGPIFSGLQQLPWICTTDKFVLPDGSNMGTAIDASCNAQTKVLYLYMPNGATTLKALPSTIELPSDMSKTTTTDGKTVNYIVRLETGTVNRGIYQIAVLFDPANDKVPNPTGKFSGWNGKLIYSYGGGTGPGYMQGLFTGGVTFDFMLKRGFAVASSTLNVGLNYSNDVVSAETTSMVKEIFIKNFGSPTYTMGWGGSGGAIGQNLVANNYPGLLDGITPSLSFPDVFTLIPYIHDCALLERSFNASSEMWTDEQKSAVAGFATWKNCNSGKGTTFATDWMNSYNLLAATLWTPSSTGGASNCLVPIIPASLIYDPVTNPNGIRCGIFDADKTLLGLDPRTGLANRPWDNVGVQYGLKALGRGEISIEQFVQLNEGVGGYDNDGKLQIARTAAPADAIYKAYAYGRVNQMQNLSGIPILDYRAYSEMDPNVHDFVRSFISRARLIKSNGSAANQVIWVASKSAPAAGPTPPQPVVDQVLMGMDEWLSAFKKDSGAGSIEEKVIRNKPLYLTDGCFTSSNQFISEALDIANGGQCGALYPAHSDPRMAAGGPLTDDVLKCRLRPLERGDYPGISDAQFVRLATVFTDGVCDYSKPGVSEVLLEGPWLKYFSPGSAKPI